MTGNAPRILAYYSRTSTTNCYLIVPPDRSSAILVDPVPVDVEFYSLLLANDVQIRSILVTHPEAYMEHAVRTLGRIFRFRIIAGAGLIFGREAVVLEDGVPFDVDGVTVEAFPFLSHDRSSRVFRVDAALFTGTIVHAGTLGDTPNAFADELLVASVKDYLIDLPDPMMVLPAVGPPSTLRAERILSPYLSAEVNLNVADARSSDTL